MKRIFISLIIIFLFENCNKKKPDVALNYFADDFEKYKTTADLVGTADDQWTEFNINEINISTNPISIDTMIVHSGKQSVRFDCTQLDSTSIDVVGKCNLNKGNLYFAQGETVYYSCWYYLQRTDTNFGTFFIWDLEEIVEGSLGVRVMVWKDNVELERRKIGAPNIFQQEPVVHFPFNQWFHVELEIGLSQYHNKNGFVKMWLDNQQVLDKKNVRTLPKDVLNLGYNTAGFYDRLQVGITAKNQSHELVLNVDDLEIKKK